MTEYDEEIHRIVTTVDEIDGYDWHTGGLIVNALTGDLYWVAQGGCSCNSFLDYPTEMTPVANWQAAVEHAKEEFGDNEAVRFAEKIIGLIDAGKFVPRRSVS
jgi:hypothetical protein